MYSLNDLATVSGLTTRTLRNYIERGLLSGEKVQGKWQFSEEALEAFLKQPFVRIGIDSKNRGIVEDFLKDNHKKGNEICTIIDCFVSPEEDKKFGQQLCEIVNAIQAPIRMTFTRQKNQVRVILSGEECAILTCLSEYKRRFVDRKN